MVTRIAIVSRAKDVVRIAFYYDVKTKLVPKPGFVPAAANLDPATISGLQAGTLIEVVQEIPFSGWQFAQMQPELQKYWADGQNKALADSATAADGVGALWDGSVWA